MVKRYSTRCSPFRVHRVSRDSVLILHISTEILLFTEYSFQNSDV